ncbi:MAG: hydroxymethylbilane synthase [Desulfobacterales bacterium]|nr:MAG: hydroxymethylbilane synthase [Desulfobacterales bacterium]
MTHISIGTRKSKLAMWQTERVVEILEENRITTSIAAMETKGDNILDRSIVKIGSKGVFTEELEEQLVSGKTDIAVHSAKDLPSILPDGFELIAFTEREKSHDVLISLNKRAFERDWKKLVIGTSSVRRVAILNHYFPGINIVPIRGNLQTRIKKMEEGQCDVLMLAYAGVKRMEYEHMIIHHFDPEQFIPPVGQGCIAIEAAKNLSVEKKKQIRECLNDAESECCLLAERAYLKKLEGGCSIPAFGHARIVNDTIELVAGLASLDGSRLLSRKMTGSIDDPEKTGATLGNDILENGGREILTQIKRQQER